MFADAPDAKQALIVGINSARCALYPEPGMCQAAYWNRIKTAYLCMAKVLVDGGRL